MMALFAIAAVDLPLAPLSSGTSLVVAALATAFSILAYASYRKRRTRGLPWVAAAFGVFALKNIFSAFNVATHVVPHDAIELGLSLFDLAIMFLLFIPLVFRRRG